MTQSPPASIPVIPAPEGGFCVAAFYKFIAIADPLALQRQLAEVCCANAIKGTIIVAQEGINGTVSGIEQAIDALLAWLGSDARFCCLEVKRSWASQSPFRRMKVKVKPEIVTLGMPDVMPAQRTGNRVSGRAWNDLIADPQTLVIDTRNDYEVSVGTFENALNPRTKSFSEFPGFVERHLAGDRKRPVAMFCTGGIRCEKASAYLISLGFENVAQLDGGILRYLAETAPSESLWRGECFVFDDRVALEHGVREGTHALCASCGAPIKARDEARRCPGCTPR